LVAGGTWLGLDVSNKDVLSDKIQHVTPGTDNSDSLQTNDSLRWIALTNYIGENNKEDKLYSTAKTSRGGLLTEYLQMNTMLDNESNDIIAESFAKNLCNRGDEYNGFSVLVSDDEGVYYCTNRGECSASTTTTAEDTSYQSSYSGPLPPGIYGLSNGLLDSPWPKVTQGKEMLSDLCKNTTLTRVELHEALMVMLHDDWRPATNQYPDSDRCSIFVPEYDFDWRKYGTRSSTTILVEKCGKASLLERTWLTNEDRWFELVPRQSSTGT
jgi:uncharacterized protein with NRDE domain